jgi:hypothetical protein
MSVSVRRYRIILSGALLLPVILFAAMGTSLALWRCRADGMTRAACCCPMKAAAARPGPQLPAVSRARCCDLEQHQLVRAPVELARDHARGLAVLMASTLALPALVLAPPVAPDRAAFADRPDSAAPPGGRTLVVHKHAFLI